jgi:hypothetical protein
MPPKGDLAGVAGAAAEEGPKGGVLPCGKKPKHWIKVRLSYKDDKSKVKAAKCQIRKGDAVVVPGPLADGLLDVKSIEAGTYDVTFPEIDAAEWDVDKG